MRDRSESLDLTEVWIEPTLVTKLKVEAFKFFFDWIEKFGNYDYWEYDEYNTVNYFNENHLEHIVQHCIESIQNPSKTNSKSLTLPIQILSLWITKSSVAHLIAPHCLTLIKENLLQHLLLTDQEVENFAENPLEFINCMRNDTEDILTVRSCIIDFIIQIAGFTPCEEKDFKYMKSLYHFWVEHMEKFDDEDMDFRLKDVLLVLLSCLASSLVATDYWVKETNQIFIKLWKVLTNDQQKVENQILTYRILYLFEEFSQMEMYLSTFTEIGKYYSLEDQGLDSRSEWIKIQAALLLPQVIMHQEMIEEFEPLLSKILSCYISLMVYNHDEIIYAFQDFLRTYSYWIQPYVMELWTQVFDRYAISKDTAAYGCISILSIILEAISYDGKIIEKLHHKLVGMFHDVLIQKNGDCIKLVISCIDLMIEALDEVTDGIASLIPRVLSLVHQYKGRHIANVGFNDFIQISDSLKSIIEKDSGKLFVQTTNGDTIFDSIKACIHAVLEISSQTNSIQGAMAAFKLIKSLLKCTGKIDNAIPDFMYEISLAMKNSSLTQFQKLEIFECFNECLEYDAELTFEAMQKMDKSYVEEFMKQNKVQELDDEDLSLDIEECEYSSHF